MGRIQIGKGPSDVQITTGLFKWLIERVVSRFIWRLLILHTRKVELKGNATQILDVLFNHTLHSGHWSKVLFGTKQKFLQRNNTTLSLVILTWLQQLQQFFLDKNTDKNGDWNILG
jgi:hypothetical protein